MTPLHVAAALIGTLAVARAVRLITSDAYPPMVWVRDRWNLWCANHAPGWAPLLTCPFCVAPYATAVDLTWAVLAHPGLSTGSGFWGPAWWLVNGWAAAAYAAAMIVVRDEPPPLDPPDDAEDEDEE